jgi:small subunit ribosomal protein S18
VSEEPNSRPGGDSSPGDSSSSGGSGPSFGGGRPGGGPGRGGRPGGGGGRGGKRYFFRRRKVCKPCADKIDHIDYKDVKLLSQFVPERGKLLPRRMFGTCAEHQRKLTLAIKRARHIALLPFQGD